MGLSENSARKTRVSHKRTCLRAADVLQLSNVNAFFNLAIPHNQIPEYAIDENERTYAQAGPVSVRLGSSVNFKENAFCGIIGPSNGVSTLEMARVGKYLSLQAEDCAYCYIQLYELYSRGFTGIRPVGYNGYYFNGSCHLIHKKTVDWMTARTKCEAEGNATHLVTIHSEEENLFIFEIISRENISSTWIGLQKENSSTQWGDGHESTFSNFDEGSHEENEACVSIGNDESPKWKWKNCTNSEATYICQKPATNRGIVHTKYIAKKRVAMDRTDKKYDNVTSGACSLYCMSYSGCISFSFNLLTGECRLSHSIETDKDLIDDLNAIYFVQSNLFEMCNF
ncbi:uncharacterized protein LOC117120087 isoform X2 [Anneissia japonica]|uniref:uncharacterized protein LOC117120087 isoform X2 n=1 Tax=Anneissia japonica TaxID=1529436 RepID=UPI0014255E20|nr:uncharacterized protein LOC117120087 isoform X2 [Anneissia japonica]